MTARGLQHGALPLRPVPRLVSARDWAAPASGEALQPPPPMPRRRLADKVADAAAAAITFCGIVGPFLAACMDWDRVIDVLAALL